MKHSPSLTGYSPADDLIEKWNVPMEPAKKIYQTWLSALRCRGASQKSKHDSSKELTLAHLREAFWYPSCSQPMRKIDGKMELLQPTTADRLYALAEAARELETDGDSIPPQELAGIFQEPLQPLPVFREWMLQYWIIPVEIGAWKYPLCLCTAKLISHLYNLQTKQRKDDSGESVRQDILDLGLFRPAKGLLRTEQFEQQKQTMQSVRNHPGPT